MSGTSDTEPAGSEIVGTRDAPLNPETKADLGTAWTVEVGVANLDSWSPIQEIDDYMDGPAADRAFVSAPLSVTSRNVWSADPAFDMSYAFVKSKGTVFTHDDTPYDVCSRALAI